MQHNRTLKRLHHSHSLSETLTICVIFCTIVYRFLKIKEGILYTFPLVMDARFGLLSCPTDAATKVAIPRLPFPGNQEQRYSKRSTKFGSNQQEKCVKNETI
eukprot:655032_1